MTKFKMGDRVAVYDAGIRSICEIEEVDQSCVEQSVLICGKWYHPKQLRKLKPKVKAVKKPREWFVDDHLNMFSTLEIYNSLGYKTRPVIHVTELFPDSAVVTRETLTKAWDYAQSNSGDAIDNMCKALGIPSPEGKGEWMKVRDYWIVKMEGFDGKVYDTDPRTWKYAGAIRLDLVKHVREVHTRKKKPRTKTRSK